MRPIAPILLFLSSCATPDPEDTSLDSAADTAPEAVELEDIDLSDETVLSKAFARTRGSLNEDDQIFYYWEGAIYDRKYADPFDSPKSDYGSPIRRFEGFNVARFERVSPGVFNMVTREITVYKNTAGKIIDCWYNANIDVPSPDFVPVVHVKNDPVNFQISGADVVEMGDMVIFPMEVMLTYESPLPVEDFPEHSAGNTYESSELFNFYTTREALNDTSLKSVPAHISWTRVGQYLPWMKAGQLEGQLIYHAQGQKLTNGWDDLPKKIRTWVEENAPEYKTAPESLSWSSNMTSWRYFKKLVEEGNYSGECE